SSRFFVRLACANANPGYQLSFVTVYINLKFFSTDSVEKRPATSADRVPSTENGGMNHLAVLDVQATHQARVVAPVARSQLRYIARDGRRECLRRGARHGARHVGHGEMRD